MLKNKDRMTQMKAIFNTNTPELEAALAAFYDLTNMTVTLFDDELRCQATAPASERKKYCIAIENDPRLVVKCNGCNRDNAALSLNKRGTRMYTCHAGICEAVAPVFIEDHLVAYIMIGRFRDEEGVYSSTEQALEFAEKYGLNKQEMLNAYNELPVLSKHQIDSAIILLNILVVYLCAKKYIKLERNYYVAKIEDYVTQHIQEKITVEQMCADLHITRYLYYDIFEKSFGEKPGEYILKRRIELAKNLLTTTEMSINEVAIRTGFQSYIYFISKFKELTGLPPLQYRKQNSAKQ